MKRRVPWGLVGWFGLFGGLGCEESPHAPASAPRERSQAVAAAEPARAPTVAPAASSATSAKRVKPPRQLCAGQLAESKGLPKKRVSRASAAQGAKLPEQLTANPGGFTWVNFWAAWCAPCKEEIPRLLGWQRELTQRGQRFSVRFVSLDDDERQLRQFLESGQGLDATYWLREGKERDEWMAAAGLGSDPELPIHLLLDATGRIRCRVQGAVEDTDFAELERLVAARSEPRTMD